MCYRPSCKCNSHSAIQETLMVYYFAHHSPPFFPIFGQTKEVQAKTTYLRSILILSSHIRLDLPSGLFPLSYGKPYELMTH
jgi:hypothetical protein